MLQSNTYPIMVVITLLVLRSQQGACAYQLVACRERALLTSKSYDCVHDLKVYNNWKSDKGSNVGRVCGQAWDIKEGEDDEKMTQEKRTVLWCLSRCYPLWGPNRRKRMIQQLNRVANKVHKSLFPYPQCLDGWEQRKYLCCPCCCVKKQREHKC